MVEGKDREETIRLTAETLRISIQRAAFIYQIEHGEIPPTGDVIDEGEPRDEDPAVEKPDDDHEKGDRREPERPRGIAHDTPKSDRREVCLHPFGGGEGIDGRSAHAGAEPEDWQPVPSLVS